jgi:hypothetical protein
MSVASVGGYRRGTMALTPSFKKNGEYELPAADLRLDFLSASFLRISLSSSFCLWTTHALHMHVPRHEGQCHSRSLTESSIVNGYLEERQSTQNFFLHLPVNVQ